jgi:hypothetical protein
MNLFDFDEVYDDDSGEGRIAGSRQFPSRIKRQKSHRGNSYRRRGAAPVVYNGNHRRRQRRIMW